VLIKHDPSVPSKKAALLPFSRSLTSLVARASWCCLLRERETQTVTSCLPTT
jgi:hypothetical protein